MRPARLQHACRHARHVRRCILVRSVDVADRARVPLRASVLQLRVSGSFRHVTGGVGVEYSDTWTRGEDPSWANRRRFPKFGPRPRAGTNLVEICLERFLSRFDQLPKKHEPHPSVTPSHRSGARRSNAARCRPIAADIRLRPEHVHVQRHSRRRLVGNSVQPGLLHDGCRRRCDRRDQLRCVTGD